MSLNNLPDELIAQMASHLPFEDVARLLQTQKRIQGIVKRYKMDQPEYEEVRFEFSTTRNFLGNLERVEHIVCKSRKAKGSQFITVLDKDVQSETGKEDLLDSLSKFTSIGTVYFHNTVCYRPMEFSDDYVKSLIKSSTKIRTARFSNVSIMLPPDEFVKLCRLFSEVFIDSKMRADLFCDEVFCQIVGTTKLNFLQSPMAKTPLTDLTLDAILEGRMPSKFLLRDSNTWFTIPAVRRFVERVCNQGIDFHGYFGHIKMREKRECMRWAAEINQQPHMKYFITTSHDDDQVVVWTRRPRISIAEFAFVLE